MSKLGFIPFHFIIFYTLDSVANSMNFILGNFLAYCFQSWLVFDSLTASSRSDTNKLDSLLSEYASLSSSFGVLSSDSLDFFWPYVYDMIIQLLTRHWPCSQFINKQHRLIKKNKSLTRIAMLMYNRAYFLILSNLAFKLEYVYCNF